MKELKTRKIDFRLSESLNAAVEAMAARKGVKRGTMVRLLIEKGLK